MYTLYVCRLHGFYYISCIFNVYFNVFLYMYFICILYHIYAHIYAYILCAFTHMSPVFCAVFLCSYLTYDMCILDYVVFMVISIISSCICCCIARRRPAVGGKEHKKGLCIYVHVCLFICM